MRILALLGLIAVLWCAPLSNGRSGTDESAGALQQRAYVLLARGAFAPAAPLLRRLLKAQEAQLGVSHVAVAQTLNTLGVTLRKLGKQQEALAPLQRALDIRKRQLGARHQDVALSHYNLGNLYKDLGHYGDAVDAYRSAVRIFQESAGLKPASLAVLNNELGIAAFRNGDFAAAERAHRVALALRQQAFGPKHKDVANSQNNLATVLTENGRYNEASGLLTAAMTTIEASLGPDHGSLAAPLINLGNIHLQRGRLVAAERAYQRAGAITAANFGTEHPIYASFQLTLADVYSEFARIEDAERGYRNALRIYETALGPNVRQVALALNNFANTYVKHRRYGEAMPLFERALSIYEATSGPEHPDTSNPLVNLAFLDNQQGAYSTAEFRLNRALRIQTGAYGERHPAVAATLNDLGTTAVNLGQFDKAQALFTRALAIDEAVFGSRSMALAAPLINLGHLAQKRGDYAAAKTYFKRVADSAADEFGREHPTYAYALTLLADLDISDGRMRSGLDFSRQATMVYQARAQRLHSDRSQAAALELATARDRFTTHIAALAGLLADGPADASALLDESFRVAQLSAVTKASTAVAAMAARFATADDKLAVAIRQRQDQLEHWRSIDKRLAAALAADPEDRDLEREQQLRQRRGELGRALDAAGESLRHDFPEYSELVQTRPLGIADAQSSLRDGEALLFLLVAEEETFVWLIRRDGARLRRAKLPRQSLEAIVRALRDTLDPYRFRANDPMPPFAAAEAYTLYDKLLRPWEEALAGINHLYVVMDGPLQSIPLAILLTEPPAQGEQQPAQYRTMPWLANRFATTVLPSANSLRALRGFATRASAGQPFIGYGDPVLQGDAGNTRGISLRGLYTRGALADVEALRELPPLPDTADELRQMAATIGAPASALRLREAATESSIRRGALADYRIIAFATHGLAAGEFDEFAEPALVLTPPQNATVDDDGLLTASEIAQLSLNADWVILSACNTAAPDGTPGAEGLSGLARAFIYAGSRSLLVSHWPVGSDAAKRLTTAMLRIVAAEPTVSRAEALRRSMLALMTDPAEPRYAHPMFWAPFVVVGDGGPIVSD